jgi:hypothetical protein
MTENQLRSALIKLAYEKPEYRSKILPLLEKEADLKTTVAGIGSAFLLALATLGVPGCMNAIEGANPGHDATGKVITRERMADQPPGGKKDLIKAVTGKDFDGDIKPEMETEMGVDKIDYKSALDHVVWQVASGNAVKGVNVNFIKEGGDDYYQVMKNGKQTAKILIRSK